MGRNLSDHSESPPRGRGSPRRRSPSRRRSPGPQRSSHTSSLAAREKPYSRTGSPKRARSRSPVSRSPVRVKPSTHTRSNRQKKSRSPVKEKSYHRTKSPKSIKSISPVKRSPSPRSKRLRRAQAETEAEKVSERENERNHGRGDDRARHRERHLDKEPSDKRSGRDGVHNGSSRSRHERSDSPSDRHHRSRHRSRSPPTATDTRARDEVDNSRGGERRNYDDDDDDDDAVAKMAATEEALEAKEKQKPSFELSGKLAAETNRVRGITLLFTEPPEARKPDTRWRLYVFKGGEVLNDPLYVHRQTCYLFGRERRVADIPTDHPSCSKQHAVLQYRQVDKEQADGMLSKQVRPYIMDLGSTNGTFLNDNRIEPHRYYELMEKDTLKFGNSSREYVLLHENSAG
ncbi:hypothetical protein LguiB_003058 [Lonicera macranthoides]